MNYNLFFYIKNVIKEIFKVYGYALRTNLKEIEKFNNIKI